MIGKYWSTGIVLRYGYTGGGWVAYCEFQDSGHCQDESTQGHLTTRHYVPLETAIDLLHKDATRLGIAFITTGLSSAPMLYYEDDGDSKEYPPPDNWRAILQEQAERIGWATYREAK